MSSERLPAWTRRLKALGLLFRRQAVATAEIARFIGVDRRTALRDLHQLEMHGVPLSKTGIDRAQRWRLPDDWRGVGLDIGLDERLALLFGRDLVQGVLEETDMGDSMAELVRHLESLDHDPLSESELSRRFYCRHEPKKSYAGFRDEIRTIISAIVQARRLGFEYTSPGRAGKAISATRPVTLLMYKRGLYVVVLPAGDDAPRFYAIERMKSVVLEATSFDYPPPRMYRPAAMFENRFGITTGKYPAQTIRLRFPARMEPYVTGREWMAGQLTSRSNDGSIELSFVAEGQELVPFVLAFGGSVEVVEPGWLRDEVVERLTAALARYQK